MKKTNNSTSLLLLIFLVGFVVDVFFYPIPVMLNWESDFRLFLVVFIWILTVKLSHFSSRATFKVALGFLILLFTLFLFFSSHPAIERIASWIYIFLLMGIIQQFFELRKINPRSH